MDEFRFLPFSNWLIGAVVSRRSYLFQCLLLHLKRKMIVSFGGIDVCVAQVILDIADGISACGEKEDASMTEGMRGNLGICQRRACLLRQEPVFVGVIADSVSCNGFVFIVENEEWVLKMRTCLQVVTDGLHGLRPKRNDTLLVAFSNEGDRASPNEGL